MSSKTIEIITSFHEGMKGTIQHDGSSSDPFPIRKGVKQGCVLALTLFGIIFSLLLSFSFNRSEDGYTSTQEVMGTFLFRTFASKDESAEITNQGNVFLADYTALTALSEEALQSLMNTFIHACREFGFITSLKQTSNISGQNICIAPGVLIDDIT